MLIALYGIPVISFAILGWAVSNASQTYSDGAALGLFASILALLGALSIQIITIFIRNAARKNRDVAVNLFRPLMAAAQVVSILLTILNGAALIAVSFYLPALLTGYYLPKLSGFIGIAAIYIIFQIAKIILSSSHKPKLELNGTLIGRSQAPALWKMVDDVSKSIGTTPPERIVLSLDDSICVTEAQLIIANGLYSGRSLIFSLPILKLLTEEQTRAVIAHEMAHFSGDDTKYSLRFFPIYKAATCSTKAIENGLSRFGGTAIAAIPALAVINSVVSSFKEVESEISRQCEKHADMKAASVVGHLPLIKGLAVIHGLGYFWKQCDEALFKALHEKEKVSTNMIEFFTSIVKDEDLSSVVDRIAKSQTAHPFNSHPVLSERIEYLGETSSILKDVKSWLNTNGNPLVVNINALIALETDLTERENLRNVLLSQLIKNAQEQNKKAA